jgi:hypothetical protein
MAEETNGVRITQAMIYQKQLEMNEVQVQMLSSLDHLSDVPDRVRALELAHARMEWVERVAYSALGAGLVGLIAGFYNLLFK